MTKEIRQPDIPVAAEQLPDFLGSLFAQWRLPQISCILTKTKKGAQVVSLASSRGSTSIDIGTLLEQLHKGRVSLLLKVIAGCFPGPEADVNTTDLLAREEYSASCLTQINPGSTNGNEALNRLVGMAADSIPVLYDSTSGLNLAEVFETAVCAQTAMGQGLPAYAIFGTTGHENIRAQKMLATSVRAIPEAMRGEFEKFTERLGPAWEDRRIQATRRLLGELPINFITAESTFDMMGDDFSLAKLVLLAQLGGGQPLLFEGGWREFRPQDIVNYFPATALATPVASFINTERVSAGGFTWYARDAVLGADTPGATLLPCKLTTHANIYKILGRYGSLWSQRADGGAILCPITRHRIQTQEQAAYGADPCDVTVVAFLAEKFPEAYARLITDFAQSCRVLTPQEAIAAGTRDKRFIIEDYFPI